MDTQTSKMIHFGRFAAEFPYFPVSKAKPVSDVAPVYLDCNATSPIDPRVCNEVAKFLFEEFGNAGSRTHEYGNRAKKAAQTARERVAAVVDCQSEEVIFTSGATESNNLAILGLERHGEDCGRKHIISTQIEHKAVLEPLEVLAERGFDVSLVPPNGEGWAEPEAIMSEVRADTVLISLAHANSETGVIQPIQQLATLLQDSDIFFHVDAAQGFGKDLAQLQDPRIDLISISGHKLFAPKGVGALIARRRRFKRPPLTPLFFGGGQERGLRPGTLPVHLVVGLGLTAELALKENNERMAACRAYREHVLKALEPLNPTFNGDQTRVLPHVLNVSFDGLDSEAVILALKDLVAISNGSACNSQSYKRSHVLTAMGLPDETIQGAIRISWCHVTDGPDWNEVAEVVARLQ